MTTLWNVHIRKCQNNTRRRLFAGSENASRATSVDEICTPTFLPPVVRTPRKSCPKSLDCSLSLFSFDQSQFVEERVDQSTALKLCISQFTDADDYRETTGWTSRAPTTTPSWNRTPTRSTGAVRRRTENAWRRRRRCRTSAPTSSRRRRGVTVTSTTTAARTTTSIPARRRRRCGGTRSVFDRCVSFTSSRRASTNKLVLISCPGRASQRSRFCYRLVFLTLMRNWKC